MVRALRLLIIGGPGAGKGTQAEGISSRFAIPHISTGNILREEVRAKSELGLRVKEIMAKGALVDDETMLRLVKQRLEQPDTETGYILDGFPRTLVQAQGLGNVLGDSSEKDLLVLLLEVSDAEMFERMMGRGRADDTEETISHRIEKFHRETIDAIEYYEKRHCLIRINGEQGIAEVTMDVLTAIANHLR